MLGNVAFMVIPWGSGFDIYPKLFAKLQCCHICPQLWRSMNTDDGKCENASLLHFILCYLENTLSHINKNRELKQRGRENVTKQ